MRGSVIKRTDANGRARYYAVVEGIGGGGSDRKRQWFSDPDTGSGFTSKRKAEDFVAALVVARGKGELVSSADTTVEQWFDHWLQSRKSQLRASTWSSYERNLRVHVTPAIGHLRLQRLTVGHLNALLATLATTGKKLKGQEPQPLSQRTVAYIATIIKAALADAVSRPEPLLPRNPADGMIVPAVASSDDSEVIEDDLDYWTAEELSRFLEHVDGHRFGPLLTVLALSGARRGEVLALRRRDVDLPNRTMSISRTVGRVGGVGMVTTSTKTRAGRRAVSLDDDLVAAIEAQLDSQDEDRRLIGPGYADEGLLFASPTGGPVNPDAVSRTFVREARAAGLRPIRLHDLRHSWATIALRHGVHPKVVQERLGHSSIAVTMGIYSHVMPVMHAEAAAAVTSAVRAAGRQNRGGLRAVR